MTAACRDPAWSELAEVFSLAFDNTASIEESLQAVFRAPQAKRVMRSQPNWNDKLVGTCLREVCAFFELTPKQFLRPGSYRFSYWRHVAMWCLKQIGCSLPQTALALGLRNHTSCLYGIEKVERTPEMLASAEEILSRCREKQVVRIGPRPALVPKSEERVRAAM